MCSDACFLCGDFVYEIKARLVDSKLDKGHFDIESRFSNYESARDFYNMLYDSEKYCDLRIKEKCMQKTGQ